MIKFHFFFFNFLLFFYFINNILIHVNYWKIQSCKCGNKFQKKQKNTIQAVRYFYCRDLRGDSCPSCRSQQNLTNSRKDRCGLYSPNYVLPSCAFLHLLFVFILWRFNNIKAEAKSIKKNDEIIVLFSWSENQFFPRLF